MTKAKDLRELTLGELDQKLVESKHELFNLRFQLATGKQDNSSRLGVVRREIARIATILREREIEAAEAAEAGQAADALEAAEVSS
jgi:large subunit ribosomal protein L29